MNPAGGMAVCLSVVSFVRCQVEAPATGRSLVQRSPTVCGVSNPVSSRNFNNKVGLGSSRVVAPQKIKIHILFRPFIYVIAVQRGF